MAAFILKRFWQSVVVIFIISVFAFSLIYLMPGDPVYASLSSEDITEEVYWQEYYRLGLDKPIYERYFDWLKNAVKGEFGTSTKYNMPVKDLLGERLPVTIYLGVLSLIISTVIGIIFGIIASTKNGTAADYLITIISNIGASVPVFWLAVLGIYVFSVKMRILPSFGFGMPGKVGLGTSLKQTILPVIAMSVGTIASTTRQTRSSMLEVIRQDFIRATRAKGIKERKVMVAHALPNALIPVITLVGLHFRTLVAGAVSIEKVFNIQGMGQLLVTAVFSRDTAVTQACILVIAIVVCAANLLVDISYGWIDPRIRVQ